MDKCMGNSRHEEWISGSVNKTTPHTSPVEPPLLLYSDDSTEDDEKKVPSPGRYCKGSKPHSTPLTLKWLEDNYETAEGVCIPRSTLYLHYLDFCEVHDTNPVNAASFGKIIRQQFPQITTRRLGTRGQSKYHYYGIGIRESSHYYDIVYSAKSVQMSVETSKQGAQQTQPFSPQCKLGTILPDFPDISHIKLPHSIPESKVVTFLMMYRSHCQRLLDTVITAQFEEVHSLLVHFWQSIPGHIASILSKDVVIKLIGVCDSILYKTVAGVVMPTVLHVLPDSLAQVIRKFARQFEDWLKFALTGLPDGLQSLKIDLSRRLSQVLRRQLSLNHLAQAAHSVVNSPELLSQLLTDWLNIDLNSIVKQTLYTMGNYTDRDYMIVVELCTVFEKLLDEQAPLEGYIDWLDRMVDTCVVKPSTKKPGSLRHNARQFLLMWSCFGTRVIRDMTLHSAPSFGSFHLIHLMFDDYVLNKIEALRADERINDFMRFVRGETNDADLAHDAPLPNGTVAMSMFIPSAWAEQQTAGVNMCNSGVSTHCMEKRSNFGYESQSDGYSSGDDSIDQSPTCILSGITVEGHHTVGRTPHVNTCTREHDELTYMYGGQQPQQQHQPFPKPAEPQQQQQPHQQHPSFHKPAETQGQQQPYYGQQSESCVGVKLGKLNQGSCYVPHSADKGTQELINTKHGHYGFEWTNSQHEVQSGPMAGFESVSQHNCVSQSYPMLQDAAHFTHLSAPDTFNFSQQPHKCPANNPQPTGTPATSTQYYQGYYDMPQDMMSSYASHNDLSKSKHPSDDQEVCGPDRRKYVRMNKCYKRNLSDVQL